MGDKSESKQKQYHDEYFWCLQAMYLQKLNCNKDEVYLPDFYEHKLENQINKKLEAKYKSMQKRNDGDIRVLKSEKSKSDKHRQKQMDELKGAKQQIEKLKDRLSTLSNMEKYKEKYHAIEKKLALKQSTLKLKELQIAENQKQIASKDGEIKEVQQKLENERASFESEIVNSKKRYVQKLDDYRDRARQMLQAKDEQLMLLQNANKNANAAANTNDIKIINNNYNYPFFDVKYDKETQTAPYPEYISETTDIDQETVEGMLIEDEKNESTQDPVSASNITIIYHQKQKIKAFEERLKRLQELLAESEEQHKRKNLKMEQLKASSFKMEKGAKDEAKDDWNHTEYLKNAILQYFDGKISINQLLSVVTVGLSLNEDEKKKAKNSKLISEQTTTSWWG